ncbi:MAG: CocE/NonD family hydrolase [Anaerolineae bacterium]
MTDRKPLNTITDLFAHVPAPRYKGVQVTSRYLTMRDDIRIAIDLMLPAGAEEPLPVLMLMARYWRSMALRVPDQPNKAPIGPREAINNDLIQRGFAVVAIDARGTGASFGTCPYPWSPDELADYAEVAAWTREQPWSNGNIGAFGISYEGATALRLAASGVSGVKGVVPQEIEFDVYADIAAPGGIFNEAFINEWSSSNNLLDSNKPSNLFPWTGRVFVKGVRPVDDDRKSGVLLRQALQDHKRNTDVFQAMKSITYRDDPFGDTGVTLDDYSVIQHKAEIEQSGAALFSWGSWLDGSAAEAVLRTYNTFSNPQIGVIGAWKHEMTAHGSPYQKPGSKPNPRQAEVWGAQAQFFEQTLRHDAPPQGKTLFYYTLGEEAWKQTDVFPLPNTQMQTWYFQAGNALSLEKPTQTEGTDQYRVNFDATTGKTNRWHTQMAKPVIYRNRAKEDQKLLTYTSAPLERDLEITGYPVATLMLASSEEDGAFYVYLEDVDETGVVRYITEGQLRGIHRHVSEHPAPYWSGMPHHTYRRADEAPLPRGKVVELTIGLQPTSVLVRRGHRLRVALAGHDQGTFARIPGQPTWQVSRTAVMASCIHLPVVNA